MKYYLTHITENLPSGFGGSAQGPLIKLLPKYQNDTGLLEHEKTHVRQWYFLLAVGLSIITLLTLLVSISFLPLYGMVPFLHPLLYKFARRYRRWCEVRAYRKQIGTCSYTSYDFAANALADKYNLGLSVDDARSLLFD